MRERGDLPPWRANRIADGVEAIEEDVSRLFELRELTREEYTFDAAIAHPLTRVVAVDWCRDGEHRLADTTVRVNESAVRSGAVVSAG